MKQIGRRTEALSNFFDSNPDADTHQGYIDLIGVCLTKTLETITMLEASEEFMVIPARIVHEVQEMHEQADKRMVELSDLFDTGYEFTRDDVQTAIDFFDSTVFLAVMEKLAALSGQVLEDVIEA